MNASISLPAPTALPHRLATRIAARLRLAVRPREHYLGGACNHADLEQRLRHWEHQQQRAAALCVGH